MKLIREIYLFLMEKKIFTLAGGLSFFVVLNGGSFLFLYIVFSKIIPNSFIDIFINEITSNSLKEILVYFFNYHNNISYSIFLIITSIYSASSLYYHLIHIKEIIDDKYERVSRFKRILSIISTLIFIVIINIVSVVSTYLILMFRKSFKLILLFTLFFIFNLIIIVSNMVVLKTYKFTKIYKGMLFTLLYFIIFTFGFIIYLNIFSNFKILYGVLSFFFILMFYIYILSVGLIIGIYINCQKLDVLMLFKKR